ncbi:MAG: UDP-2,3-diacylglucosamine diphosphatase LpxI [Thermodesulfobacteriota bacterium]
MRIGLIAGSGQFPIIFSQKARSEGFEIYAAAHHNETDPKLEAYVDAIRWIHLGQIRRMIRFFKENRVSEAVMLGAIQKTRMFSDVKPDIKAISLIAKMRHTHDDGILRAFAGVLADEGIQVKPSTFLLPGLLARKGCWTKRRPNRAERADIELGWKLAKEIGRLDIGQCVVVGGGSVLAVEAIDGTDATIRRGGQLGNGTAVLIKVSKPNQDLRFDMPAVGAETIKTMAAAGVTALALEAGKAVVFDREEMVELADTCGIAIVAME